jgi:hypothetical protein
MRDDRRLIYIEYMRIETTKKRPLKSEKKSGVSKDIDERLNSSHGSRLFKT